MGKLSKLAIRPGYLDVTETYGLGKGVDVLLRAGHEMPSVCGVGMTVPLQVDALLGRGQVSALAGIDADNNYIEVLAGNKLDHLQGACQPVQFL